MPRSGFVQSLSKEQLIELVLGLAQRVAELDASLELPAKTPENSSVPPSQGRKPAVPRKKGRRRKGRPGIARALDPNPTQVREVHAACCRIAGGNSRRRRRRLARATTTSRSRRSAPR